MVLRRIWIANDRVADTRNRATMGATFGKAYTPDGVVEPAGDQDRAINAYNNTKRRLYHWGNEPVEVGGRQIEDPNYNLNVFGWALCGRHAQIGCSVLDAMGITNRFIGLAIGSSGHNIYEAFYDGDWHLFDTMTTMYVFDRANPPSVASAQDIKDDSSLMLSAVADGRACPGFLLCGDDLVGFANGLKGYSASDGGVPASHNTDMNLGFGQTFSRTWESWVTQHEPLDTGHPGAPYHHEASKDWKDTVNFPYWEPYELNSEQNLALNIVIESSGAGYSKSYRRWANGTDELAPDFRSAGYQALLNGTPVNIATFNDDVLSPDLHANNPGTASEVVFKISPAFYITDGSISGDFFRNDAGDLLKIYTSTNGTSWTQVWEHSATGTVHLDQFNLRTRVFGQFAYWVKIAFTANGTKTDAGVSNLVIRTIYEHNKGAMAYLDKGLNRITVTFDNPQDLVGNCALKVTYRWKEFDGTGWTIDKIHEQYVPTSPFTFNITPAGSRVPKTESIRMEVIESPPPCDTLPSTITDLAVADTTDQSVSLTWTAPVDSCNGTAPATAYDLRYSTAPIDAANFDLAAQVSNPPAPGAPGSLESFTVSGLTPSTTYYFAVKVRSLGGALSDLSNVVFADTDDPDLIPPAWVGNLLGRTSTRHPRAST